MNQLLNLTNKLLKNEEKLNSFYELKNKEHTDFYRFFKILENKDILNIFEGFKKEVDVIFKEYINSIITLEENKLNLEYDDMLNYYSLILIKSLIVSSTFEKEYDFLYINSNIVLKSLVDYEEKFWVYYFNKKFNNQIGLKKIGFKVYLVMCYKDYIFEKNEIVNEKKELFFSLGHFSFEWIIDEKINISLIQYKLVVIENNYYFTSDFFTKTTEVFRSNTSSGKKLVLKNYEFIEKNLKRFVVIDKEDFNDILKIYEEEFKISMDHIEDTLKNVLSNISIKRNQLFEIRNECKCLYNIRLKEILLEEFKSFNSVNVTKENLILYSYRKIIELELRKDFKRLDENIIANIMTLFLNWFTNNEINNVKMNNYLDFIIFIKFNLLKIENIENSNEVIDMYKKINNKMLDVLNIDLNKKINTSLIYKDTKKSLDNLLEKEIDKNLNIFKKIFDLGGYLKELKVFYRDFKIESQKLEKEIKDLQREFSKFYVIYIFGVIKRLNIFEKKIYIPFYFDFRGRIYYDSIISITYFKPSRYFLNYGKYTYEEIIKLKKISRKNHLDFIEDIELIMEKFNIKLSYILIKETIFWVLISLGKEFIEKNKEFYNIKELIKKGKEILNDYKTSDIEEKIIINHYKKIIISLRDTYPKKRFIHKDATASFIQNTIRIIGPKDKDALIKANLLSKENWYDTYLLGINSWKKNLIIKDGYIIIKKKDKILEISCDYLKYFNRKTAKKTIMTSPYAASFPRKWEYFINEVEKNFEINIENNKDILNLFSDFNIYIEKKFWTEHFLAFNSSNLVDLILKQIKDNKTALIKTFDATSNIIYYNSITKKFDFIISIPEKNIKLRRVKNYLITNEKDVWNEKLKQSIRANWVHFSDASLVREVNIRMDETFLTIHDCFLVDIFSVSIFIERANQEFKKVENISIAENKKIFEEIDCIFIFI